MTTSQAAEYERQIVIDPPLPSVVWMPGTTLDELKVDVVAKAILHYGSMRKAALHLGVSKETIYRWSARADAAKEPIDE